MFSLLISESAWLLLHFHGPESQSDEVVIHLEPAEWFRVSAPENCRFSGRSEKGLDWLIVLDSGFSVGKRLPPDSAVRCSCSFPHAYVTPVFLSDLRLSRYSGSVCVILVLTPRACKEIQHSIIFRFEESSKQVHKAQVLMW